MERNTEALEHFKNAGLIEAPAWVDPDYVGGAVLSRFGLRGTSWHDDDDLMAWPIRNTDDGMHASSIEVANAQWVRDHWEGEDWLVRIDYAYGNIAYYVIPELMGEEEDFADVACTLTCLDDYPVFDEDYLTTVENEWVEEQVRDFLASDVLGDLPEATTEDMDDLGLDKVQVFWNACGEAGVYPTLEDGENVYLIKEDAVRICDAAVEVVAKLKNER